MNWRIAAIREPTQAKGRPRTDNYMIGSVMKLGQALADRLCGTGKGDWAAPLLLWVSFIAGAMTGTFAASALGFAALWLGSLAAIGFAAVARSMSGLLVSNS